MLVMREPIDTAAARAGGQPIVIPVRLVVWEATEATTEVVEYRFAPSLGVQITRNVARIQRLVAEGGDQEAQLEAMIDLLVSAALPETREALQRDMDDNRIGFIDLAALVTAFTEEASGTHPTRRAPSLAPSPASGETSTPMPPPEA